MPPPTPHSVLQPLFTLWPHPPTHLPSDPASNPPASLTPVCRFLWTLPIHRTLSVRPSLPAERHCMVFPGLKSWPGPSLQVTKNTLLLLLPWLCTSHGRLTFPYSSVSWPSTPPPAPHAKIRYHSGFSALHPYPQNPLFFLPTLFKNICFSPQKPSPST